MKRKILAFLGAVMLGAGVLNVAVYRPVEAATCSGNNLFGIFEPWYKGLACDTDGSGKQTISGENFSEDKITTTIILIVLTITNDLLRAGGVFAVIMVIYAGYLMITAAGEPGKVAQAQKVITRAVTGLVIMILATTIVTIIKAVFY
ncbi:hypothetical protein IJI70_00870 [Candidatus Saccharibacteria bacterium]|nr:hypothetical protein [Candidatus Saccharibacteria bacterium]